MKYTSAEAAKLLRQLTNELASVQRGEMMSCEFLAALGEDVDSVRPSYDYEAVQSEIEALQAKIRILKHTINVFNVTHSVPGFDMTIDQMLVYIPQLTRRCEKLDAMRSKLPKSRENAVGYGKNNALIDYRYMNYDVALAKRDYDAAAAELAKAQLALDRVNNTETMEIEL